MVRRGGEDVVAIGAIIRAINRQQLSVEKRIRKVKQVGEVSGGNEVPVERCILTTANSTNVQPVRPYEEGRGNRK
jgi:uncharacterized protein YcbX